MVFLLNILNYLRKIALTWKLTQETKYISAQANRNSKKEKYAQPLQITSYCQYVC